MWEPLVWEFTSGLSAFILAPLLFFFFRRCPPRLSNIKRQLLQHWLGSIAFSLSHVVLMVALRHFCYQLSGGTYEFGPWAREFWYEYQKDAWGYVLFYAGYNMLQFIYVRLKGEASPIAQDEAQADESIADMVPEQFLVKKLDKEFIVKVADIEWAESAGNYVNLHSKGRIYPLRSTLSKLTTSLEPVGFSRIHRSHLVNHEAIESIGYQSSGDGEVQLTSGKVLNLSRRYKEAFKAALA